MNVVNFKTVKEAALRLERHIATSPLVYSESLSDFYQAEIWLKLETEHSVKSYKIRGALNAMIGAIESGIGINRIVCASAGNHAQGIAQGCNLLGVHGDVFMPIHTPKVKVEAVKAIGGSNVAVHMVGEIFDEAMVAAHSFCREYGGTFIHPFDDEAVISGQGTVALEILGQMPKPVDFVVVPVGGGGLASGVSTVFKKVAPETQLVGVEPIGAPSMTEALKADKPVTIAVTDKFVDGAAVARVGSLPFDICRSHVDEVVLVAENYVAEIKEQLANKSIVVEPAGALSVAALDVLKYKIKGKRVICIISGGNDDPTRKQDCDRRRLIHNGLENDWTIGGKTMEMFNYILDAQEAKILDHNSTGQSVRILFKVRRREDLSLLQTLLHLGGSNISHFQLP